MINVEEIVNNPNIILEHIRGLDLSNCIIYIAGSLLEGFGNEKSDIDVYIIYRDQKLEVKTSNSVYSDIVNTYDDCIVRNIIHNNVRFDFEYWDWDKFSRIIDTLNSFSLNSYSSSSYRLTEFDVDLIHRIKYAKPLINPEIFRKLYDSINFDNLGYYYVLKNRTGYSGLLEDIHGAYSSKDYGSAFFMVRRLLDNLITSYLALKGETNPSLKWLYRKLKRYVDLTGDSELLDRYIWCQNLEFEDETVRNHIKQVLAFSQEINNDIQKLLSQKQICEV